MKLSVYWIIGIQLALLGINTLLPKFVPMSQEQVKAISDFCQGAAAILGIHAVFVNPTGELLTKKTEEPQPQPQAQLPPKPTPIAMG